MKLPFCKMIDYPFTFNLDMVKGNEDCTTALHVAKSADNSLRELIDNVYPSECLDEIMSLLCKLTFPKCTGENTIALPKVRNCINTLNKCYRDSMNQEFCTMFVVSFVFIY
jgi:hypothetical protein